MPFVLLGVPISHTQLVAFFAISFAGQKDAAFIANAENDYKWQAQIIADLMEQEQIEAAMEKATELVAF